MLARKSVKQRYRPSAEIARLMSAFGDATNECIKIGFLNNASSLKRMSQLCYKQLRGYTTPAYYKLGAISRASGFLAARKKSIRRGMRVETPCAKKLVLSCCYRIKILNGKLRIPLGNKRFEFILLNSHTLAVLSEPALRVNSFVLTENALVLSLSKEVQPMKEIASTVGIDRNLRNLAVGNNRTIRIYDMSKTVEIVEMTNSIVRSFRRNDRRVRSLISSKYGTRRRNRVNQLLHRVSRQVVNEAAQSGSAIVFEDITDIRKLYRAGNGQSLRNRRIMNSWPFARIMAQIQYKAAWRGIPIIQLSSQETRGTSSLCPRCGERLQANMRRRMMWCHRCEKWTDRDIVAAMNIARQGWVRFAQSKGLGSEVMTHVSETKEPLIM